MGCNQSKQDDIKASNDQQRERYPSTPQPASAASQSTPSRSINSTSVPDPNGMMLGMSYSDQRENEHGYFKDIVERTALNFIDVSATGLQEKQDAAEGNNKDFGTSTFDAREFEKLFGVPNTSDQPIRASLSNPTPKQLLDMATNTNQTIAAGLKAMHVADVGEIVINFPEIPM